MPSGILDDMAFSQTFSKAGFPIHLYGGKELIAFRMYPEGFKQLIQGVDKGFCHSFKSHQSLYFVRDHIMDSWWSWLCIGFSYGSMAVCASHLLSVCMPMHHLCQTCWEFHPCFLCCFSRSFSLFLFFVLWSLIQTYLLEISDLERKKNQILGGFYAADPFDHWSISHARHSCLVYIPFRNILRCPPNR